MAPNKKHPKSISKRQPVEEIPNQQEVRRARFVRELLGIFLGISLAMMISSVVPEIRERYSLGVVILWGGAVGGLLTSYERFEKAGAALTRGDNKVLNYLIGVSLPLLILLSLYLYTR